MTLKTTRPHDSLEETTGIEERREAEYPEDLSEVMDFSRYDLRTTLRLIVLSGESRRVDVRRGSKHGSIYIKDGEIYRVVSDELMGDEALFDILSWDKTAHDDVQQTEIPQANVKISTNVFLNLMKNQTY